MEDKILTIPAVALRGMTILPGMVAHFDISRDKSLRAVEEAMKETRSFLSSHKKIQRKKILREKICMKWGFWLWFVRS